MFVLCPLLCAQMRTQASGCTVQDDCVKKFDEMKLKRAYKYMVFCIESGEIKVDQCGAKDVRADDTQRTSALQRPHT